MMAAKIKIKIDLSGWYAKNARVIAAVHALKGIVIGPPEGDEDNIDKAVASFDRGDLTYPLSRDATSEGSSMVVTMLKEIASDDGSGETDERMQEVGEVLVEDIRIGILGGRVTGPTRSDEWIEEKQNNTNMFGKTGDFTRSLEARLQERR